MLMSIVFFMLNSICQCLVIGNFDVNANVYVDVNVNVLVESVSQI